MDVSQYLEIFIEEAKEHLQNLNEALLEMEKISDNQDLVNEIFRVAHTLKGMAATMGFKKMTVLTHDMENVLAEIRNGNMHVTPELLDVLFQCLDALEQYVEHITETGGEGDKKNQAIIDRLNLILEGKSLEENKNETPENIQMSDELEEKKPTESEVEEQRKHNMVSFNEFERSAIIKAQEEEQFVYGITIFIAESCVLKSARAFIIFRTLESLGQIIKAHPSVQDIEDEKFNLDFSVFIASKEDEEKILKELYSIAEVKEVLVDKIHIEAHKQDMDQQEEKIDANRGEDYENSSERKEKKSKDKAKPKANRTVRVDIERLDNLMNLVSELIIIKNGLETVDNSNQNMHEQIEYLERITTNLHDAVMKVRMVPVERVFNRFPRLVRDLARQLNKNIELHMAGEETELDRTVIDEIGDPLVHLIRNACDHGQEMPQERQANGKSEMGHVRLEAYQDGNNVVIEVADDGYGIDVEKIKAKALNNGVITKEQAEAMSRQDSIELLFKPSFSTVEEISDVSGRGVGLDVVKTKIEALGGDIDVKTKLGRGSKFIIRLPLTLAIIQALMVYIGNEKYAIPLNTIQNIEDVQETDIKFIQNQEVINLRGQVIPIIRIDSLLDITPVACDEEKENMIVVIVNKGDKQAGFVVDGLLGQQEIVIKTLGKYLTNIKLIAGATILGDGEVALILNVNSLV